MKLFVTIVVALCVLNGINARECHRRRGRGGLPRSSTWGGMASPPMVGLGPSE